LTRKQIMRSIAFMLIVCVMLLLLCEIFELPDTTNESKRLYTFRNLPKDTVDVALIGCSGTDRYWLAPQAFEEYGISSYPFSMDAMPAWLYTNAIEEVLTYQEPELFILDTRAFTQYPTTGKAEAAGRRLMDNLNFYSRNRFKTAVKTCSILHELDNSNPKWDLSYFLPFIKYHSAWADKDFSLADRISRSTHEYGGYQLFESSASAMPLTTKVYPENHLVNLHPISERSLYEVLDLIEQRQLNVLFISTPQSRDPDEAGRANKVLQLLKEAGQPYIAYYFDGQRSVSTEHEKLIDLNPATDFYNAGHVNFYGAQKFTQHFSEYLLDNYDLADHRGEEKFDELWDGVYDRLKQAIENQRKQQEE